ncbi:uncharacterized protein KGF55_004376 [Candida pseudojiufengensis]|uniref:uncharacterized protein n=1 Tax=Candida pseudojiufengensis TaxID=497109 RepID=UPI002223FB64|nr:uncharacterized protein KGF55_004376 [Candida pseudojiufengensis]KAI5960806.1 hypothetical protein KGF55_004376 [Candida pseudojiufengensis]
MAVELSFTTLPSSIRNKIISYLPQHSLLCLSQTNYEFYHPCLQKLYQKIIISETQPIQQHSKRGVDFQNSINTIISGRSKFSKNKNLELKVINARILILIQALKINVELIEYVKEIYIFGNFNEEIRDSLQELIDIFQTLDICHIFNAELRSNINMSHLQLKSIIVDENTIINGPKKELIISENQNLDLTSLTNIQSLIIAKDNFLDYYKWCETNIIGPQIFLKKLKKFKLVFHSSDLQLSGNLISRINWLTIKELELVIPCSSSDENYVLDCLDLIPINIPTLRKLSIVQGSVFETHSLNESFDLNILNFISNYISNLSYLSIKHNTPQFGNFSDGVEGNYHRRFETYLSLLPKIITKSESPNFILNLPNLFQTFACYEQNMNAILWNGCKCDYCDEYLNKLDEFLFRHKYYSKKLNKYKDLNVSHLMSIIANELNERQIQESSLTQLDQLSFPLWNNLWDFHSIPNSKDLKCLDKQTVDYGEYSDEDLIDEELIANCEFNSKLYQHIPKAISHYINTMIQEVLNLNRGNAEARIDELTNLQFKDGGDINIDTKFNLRKIIINGFIYNFGNEINGTHFYEVVYS